MTLVELLVTLGILFLLIVGFTAYRFAKRREEKQIDPDLRNLFEDWNRYRK